MSPNTVFRLKSVAHRMRRFVLRRSSQQYWTHYNVTLNRSFRSAADSLAYFHWRNDQYIDYIDLMPVTGLDGKVVVDYGCGPGNDLVGIGTYSAPARLIGIDVSSTSLALARERLALHGIRAELQWIDESSSTLPLADGSVDYIHSSGVLHHVPDPVAVLHEFRRVLKPGGECRIMVYNYDSLHLHLHVAYLERVVRRVYRDMAIRDAFSRFTDGEECPIARVYKPEEFLSLAEEAGLDGVFLGAGMAVAEAADFPLRFAAIASQELEPEHREFLLGLTIDPRGLPQHGGTLAGEDGCYSLRPS